MSCIVSCLSSLLAIQVGEAKRLHLFNAIFAFTDVLIEYWSHRNSLVRQNTVWYWLTLLAWVWIVTNDPICTCSVICLFRASTERLWQLVWLATGLFACRQVFLLLCPFYTCDCVWISVQVGRCGVCVLCSCHIYNIYTYIHIYIYTYIHIYIYTYIQYIHIYIYTYIHIYSIFSQFIHHVQYKTPSSHVLEIGTRPYPSSTRCQLLIVSHHVWMAERNGENQIACCTIFYHIVASEVLLFLYSLHVIEQRCMLLWDLPML